MIKALAGTPVEQFNRPSGVKTVTLDGITGRKPGSSNRTSTDIFPSWYKIPDFNGQSSEVNINKLTGNKVNDACPPTAENIEVRTVGAVTAEIPSSDGAYSRWFAPIAAWAAANGFSTDVTQIPTDTCEVKVAPPTVKIKSPTDGQEITGPDVSIVFTVDTTVTVKTTKVSIGTKEMVATPGATSYTAKFTGLTPGNKKVVVTVTDSKNQTTTTTINISVK